MASQISSVVNELRRRIFAGVYAPGERLVELQLVADLGASRTPIRLAFEELERAGMLVRLPTRGFQVRGFTADDIANSIDVRGTLEGMAAKLVAQRGASPETLDILNDCVVEGRHLLQDAQVHGQLLDSPKWFAMNGRFHRTLVEAANNDALKSAIDFVSKSPLAGAAALMHDGKFPQQEFRFIQRSQQDHEDVLQAIAARDGTRAENLMREHAQRSRDNKRELLTGTRFEMVAPAKKLKLVGKKAIAGGN
jgi:GntR family transcriptional regulator of vanillate catabolism